MQAGRGGTKEEDGEGVREDEGSTKEGKGGRQCKLEVKRGNEREKEKRGKDGGRMTKEIRRENRKEARKKRSEGTWRAERNAKEEKYE